MGYTVRAVAELAGVSVRTLHHYDHIGLLHPAETTPAGYRVYSRQDLERLQQILFYRELGLGLREIGEILASPGFDRREAMAGHRRFLVERRDRLDRMVSLVDETLAAWERGCEMDEERMFDGLDQRQLDEWRREATERWGKARVDESYRRYDQMSAHEKQAMLAEGGAIELDAAALMGQGAGGAAVQAVMERWFRYIGRFYEVTSDIFRGLGDMYVEDERFRAHYEEIKPGLAEFMRAAMHVYADGVDNAGKRG